MEGSLTQCKSKNTKLRIPDFVGMAVLSGFEIRFTRYERREICSTSVESILQIAPFYAKQTQFQNRQFGISSFKTSKYVDFAVFGGEKTKPIPSTSLLSARAHDRGQDGSKPIYPSGIQTQY